ncbi:hypothetical protein [Sphingobacterium multivorum]|uniref:hypothetical protein n=1 Tax=Sphingobacterium multivorum TaxID=28454 RepID=UPI0021153852|nr:hypothetical protein [Sphingobacterium multivorum]
MRRIDRTDQRKSVAGKRRNAQCGLNFNTSYIKPYWGTASKDDAVQATKAQETNSTAKEDENDDLPF